MPNVFHTLLPTIMAEAMAVATPCTATAAEQADTAVTGSSSRVVHRVEADYATGAYSTPTATSTGAMPSGA